MSQLHTAIIRPLETEKTYAGQKNGSYTFSVRYSANKKEIKQAIEKYYGVKVKSVRTIITPPKTRAVGRGRTLIKRPLGKKAVVTTVGGSPIDINKITI